MPQLPTLSAMMVTTTQRENVQAAWKASVMGTLNVLMIVVAVRSIVLVAVGGGIALTWLALSNPDPLRLGALGIYAVGVAIPTVWLAARK